MKRVIRCELFETNSSTTHSLIIMPKDVYKKWADSDLYVYDGYSYKDGPKPDTLYTLDEAVDALLLNSSSLRLYGREKEYLEEYKNNDDDDYRQVLLEETENILEYYGFYTYESWNGGDYALEEDETSYKTESGDEIMIRAKFGWDG